MQCVSRWIRLFKLQDLSDDNLTIPPKKLHWHARSRWQEIRLF
jgi:hypothetical protein